MPSSLLTPSVVRPSCAVVVGSSGGIGRALVDRLARDGGFEQVHALSRSSQDLGPGTRACRLDLTDEASIADAVAEIAASGAPVGLAIVATGFLHGPDLRPEKAWRELDADRLAASFRVNTIGPALVAKHVLPLMPRQGKAVFAALSARVDRSGIIGSAGGTGIGPRKPPSTRSSGRSPSNSPAAGPTRSASGSIPARSIPA